MSTKNPGVGGNAKDSYICSSRFRKMPFPALQQILSPNIDPCVTFHVTCRCHLATFADSSIVACDFILLPSQTPSPDVVRKDVRYQPGKCPRPTIPPSLGSVQPASRI